MHFTFTSEPRTDDGLVERDFSLGGVPGILWTPAGLADDPDAAPAPLILQGHPGGLEAMRPRLAARARRSAVDGHASAALELPGGGERSRIPELEAARAELRAAVLAGGAVPDGVVDRLVLPLVDLAVPELRSAMDALLALPGIGGPVGYSGGIVGIGIRLAVVEPRLAAVGFFAGSYVPLSLFEEARRISIPVHVLLQWDDEGNDRRQALDLFDAFGSAEKTLQANLGGHRGVPAYAGEDAARFFARHLVAGAEPLSGPAAG
ncbi:alpha/beta hydrolase [Agromyces seonyuensis]|uniref:Alpha/beta hydrolase n=1 Tax=Agromyces seonyuensis TaxID=2662446 RepID=A0A6I4P1N0_9MICO|nr:alpha/beta hydrolase [Agromyces seonyuensis]MWB99442.1 alpha/beta hydrolase [Agromyces seonyuensis]